MIASAWLRTRGAFDILTWNLLFPSPGRFIDRENSFDIMSSEGRIPVEGCVPKKELIVSQTMNRFMLFG